MSKYTITADQFSFVPVPLNCSDDSMNDSIAMSATCKDVSGNPCVLLQPKLLAEPINLSLDPKATASQSCKYPPSSAFPASTAIDGNKDLCRTGGCFSLTCLEPNPWWRVDLGALKRIYEVKVFDPRPDLINGAGVIRRLQKFHVRFYATDPSIPSSLPILDIYKEASGKQDDITEESARVIKLNGEVEARYVEIQLEGTDLLHLREVEVMGWNLRSQVSPGQKRSLSSFAPGERALQYVYNSSKPDSNQTIDLTMLETNNASFSKGDGTLSLDTSTQKFFETNCEEKTFIFTYRLESTLAKDKEILHFASYRNGEFTDLYGELGSDERILRSGTSSYSIETNKTIKLCSDDDEVSTIVLDFENADFNAAFDLYSRGMTIADSKNEDECQKVRELLGFDPD